MEYEIAEDESVAFALICSTTQCDGCETCDFDPLESMVDGDALAELFGPRLDGAPRDVDWRISLENERCTITIENGELISIRQPSANPAP